jgi:ligand-binding sensor domain-containing protein
MSIVPEYRLCDFSGSVSIIFWKRILNIFISLFFLIVFAHCHAQDSLHFRFNHYSSEDTKIVKGISQNSVNCILQDSKGFMWFGTWDGLNRFDGLNFVIYLPGIKENIQNLGNQTIRSLYEDKDENLWVGTEWGLALLNRKTQLFHKFIANPKNPNALNCDTVNCILEDNDGLLWIGTTHGINVLDKKTGIFSHYTRRNGSLTSDTIQNIFRDKAGLIWIATKNGLTDYNKKTGKFRKYFHSTTNQNSLCNNDISSILQDKNGLIWLGTTNGLNSYNPEKNIFTLYNNVQNDIHSSNTNIITSILEDRKGRFWVGTLGGGLNLFDKITGKFYSYKNNPSDQNSLTNNFINCLYEDNTGIIWIGNRYKGIDKIDPNCFSFDVYRHIPYNQNSLCNNVIWSVFEDDNNLLWIGTAGGLNIWDRKKNIWMQLINEPGKINAFSSNSIRSIFKDKNGIMWIGTDDAGVDRFDPVTSEIINFSNNTNNKNYICNNTIWNIFQDKAGFIWFGTSNGLAKYDPKQNSFVFFKNIPTDPTSLSNNLVYNVFQDSKENIWIGTNDGLDLYNPIQNNFKVYKTNSIKGTSINNNTIFSVFEDNVGYLWICTMGGGLNKYNIKKNNFTYYTDREGLPNNVVYAVIQDKYGFFWLSTNHGLCRFNPISGACINYDVKDGLQSYEYNGGAQLKTRNGELFFGGMNGFNLFSPEEIPERKNPPPPVLTGFRIFNEQNYREYNNGDTIELSYFDNFFSFEFSSLDFSNGSNLFYEFKLENINYSWTNTDADHRMAEYTNIQPGTYKFKVRASSTNYFGDSKETCIIIIIKPPWWKTWAFRISLTLIILLLIGFIIRSQLKRIRRKNEFERTMLEMEKKIFETERKALRLQMNPHFIFNTLNAIQYFIFQNDKLSANKYISMFSKLIRQILINSQQNTILLKDDLIALELYIELELLRFENMFDFKISVIPDESILEYHIPSMILQPYVENAIRHGLIHRKDKGFLKITVKKEIAGRILCIIEDNGIGREKAKEIRLKTKPDHQSMGTQITESRLRLINKLYGSEMFISTFDLKDSQENAIGTRVELNIPVMGNNQ